MPNQEFKDRLEICEKIEKEEFLKTIEKKRIIADSTYATLNLLTVQDLIDLRKQNFGQYMVFIFQLFESFSLFPKEDTYVKLREIGFSDRLFKWFIDINVIESEFEKIAGHEMIIFRNIAINIIQVFLDSKLNAEIANRPELVLGKENSEKSIVDQFRNYFRRRKYSEENSKKIKNIATFLMDENIDNLKSIIKKGEKETKKYTMDTLKGDSEKYLLGELITCCISKNKISDGKFTSIIYGLLNLFLKGGKKLLSEEEWLNRGALYGNDYNRYLTIRVKKLTNWDGQSFFENG